MTTENPYTPPNADITSSDHAPGELASRWKRFFGALIDGLLIGLVTLPLIFMTGYIDRAASGTQSFAEVILLAVLGIVVFLAINAHLLKKKGQSVGKLLMGTQIVSVDSEQLLPLGKLIGQRYVPLWLVSQVPGIGQLAGLVNALFIFRDDKRCLHDLIAGTKVINYRPALVAETSGVNFK